MVEPWGGPRRRRGSSLLRLLDAVAPRRCAACDLPAPDGLCPACRRALDRLPLPPGGVPARAAFPFEGPVRELLHRAKYGRRRSAMEALAAAAARRLGPVIPPGAPDVAVPVPLGRRRRRERGFNQAEVLCDALAHLWGLRICARLARVRETSPQVGRDAGGRRQNVAGAFRWEGGDLSGAAVWLVDDVVTTGATAAAAAAALRAAGASRVDVVAAAIVP